MRSRLATLMVSPAVGVTIAYRYETGFCGFFGVPAGLIELSWTTVLGAIAATILVLLAIFYTVNFLVMLVGSRANKGLTDIVVLDLVRLVFPFVLALVALLVYGPFWREWIWYVSILIVFGALLFGLPLLTHRNVSGYRNKLLASEELDADTTSIFSVAFRGRTNQINNAIAVFLLLMLLWFVPYMIGNGNAMREREFFTLPAYDNAVVVRVYGSRLVCARLGETSGTVRKQFFVVGFDTTPRPELVPVRIGPLSVESE